MNRYFILAIAAACASSAIAQQNSPFAPPQASLHYALDRTCDLLNVDVTLDIDYPNRTVNGTSVSTLSPLRNGLTEVMLMAGPALTLKQVKVDGKTASFRREGRNLFISVPPTKRDKQMQIAISYSGSNAKGRSFGGGGGWHWIEPNATNPSHVGFWTQGESEYNSEWAPTWDYPNDMATSETHTTVQADWDVVGNGVLTSTQLSPDKKRKTYNWKMTQPHATYLLAVVGGPFDIKKDKWEGVDLWYVVPKGEGDMIDDSFGHTKDMLSFYSKALGVKYAWPKYAQNAMYDFGGGMENVSSTTLGEGSLTEARDGWYRMDSLNSHELGHQWFGDLVTCKDWGDTWLNESFATYMQDMYFEHSRGKDGYDWEIFDNINGYLAEARRYKRPLSTKMYPNGDAMFDSHTYPKGGTILHTLRRFLGDESFFGGLNYYLTKWRHTPVESAQLRRAFTEYSGINVEPFWAQWIDKPGHPVLDYTWSYDSGKGELTVKVKQTQDTSNGTPLYSISNAKVGVISGGKLTELAAPLNGTAEQSIVLKTSAPEAVLLDPNRDYLREIPTPHWLDSELIPILKFAPCAPDRADAMKRLLDLGGDANIQAVVDVLKADKGLNPAFRNVMGLVNLAKPELRSFWVDQLTTSQNSDRQASAVQALGKLPADTTTTTVMRLLINDKEPIRVVVNAINALAAWDAKGNAEYFKKAQGIKDRRGQIKRAADSALGN